MLVTAACFALIGICAATIIICVACHDISNAAYMYQKTMDERRK